MLNRKIEWFKNINGKLMFLFSIMFAIYLISMPFALDDYWYSSMLYDYIEKQTEAIPLNEIFETWRYHWNTDNGRFANFFYVPFLIIPRWIGATLGSLCLVYFFYAGIRLFRFNWQNNGLVSVYVFMFSLMLPWYDSIFGLCYQFNYLFSTALSVFTIFFFIENCNSNECNIYKVLFVGILLGAWHEAFSIPLLIGIFFAIIFDRTYRTKSSFILLFFLSIGIVWLIVSPGFFHRFEDVSMKYPTDINKILYVLFLQPCFIIMIATILIVYIIKKRNILKNTLVIILFISAVSSVLIHIFSSRSPRAGWWGEFASILLIIYVLHKLLPLKKQTYRIKNFIYYLLWIISGVHMIVVDYYSIKIGDSFEKAINEYRSNKDIVYQKIITEIDSPIITMLSPDFTLFNSPTNLEMINNYFNVKGTKCEFKVIPLELKNINSMSGESIPGNTKIRRIGNKLFMPTEELSIGEMTGEVNFGILKRKVRLIYYPFISERDGKRYAYIYPWRCVIEMKLGNLSEINNLNIIRGGE